MSGDGIGQGQTHRWYAAPDPASQTAIDTRAEHVGDAIDTHYP